MPLLTLALIGWELPQARPLWLAPQVERVLLSERGFKGPLGSVGFHEPSLMLLCGTDTVMLASASDGATALHDGRVAGLLVSDRDTEAFRDASRRIGLSAKQVATFRTFNYSRGRWMEIGLFESLSRDGG
jgi:hypothetical protein